MQARLRTNSPAIGKGDMEDGSGERPWPRTGGNRPEETQGLGAARRPMTQSIAPM